MSFARFIKKTIDKQKEYEVIIPKFLFAESKKFILVEILFCISNENTVKEFLNKFQSFVHHKLDIAVNWSTEKIKMFFRSENKKSPPCL